MEGRLEAVLVSFSEADLSIHHLLWRHEYTCAGAEERFDPGR